MNYRLMVGLGAFVIIVGGVNAAITGDRDVWFVVGCAVVWTTLAVIQQRRNGGGI